LIRRIPQILVADDDRTVRTVISHALSKQGYQVGAATSVAGLWDMATTGRGDVLITDVNFPDGDALDLLPRLQAKRPDLVIIVMSAQANLLTAIKTQQRGVFDYLPKPFELRQLLDVMSRAVSDEREGKSSNTPAATLPEQIPSPLLGKSPAMQVTFKLLSRIATQSVPVLIKAESGSRKQTVAQTLHEMSHLSSASFETADLSCVETERHAELLFGARGLFTRTSVGTLFLNNIEYLSAAAQKFLVQFLVTGASNVSLQPAQHDHMRLACGTSTDLKQQVSNGAFREDLFFELSVAELELPPLRKRQEDIPLLSNWYCDQLNEQFQTDRHFSSEAVTCLQSYHWPGNVREFEAMLKRLFISTTGRQISLAIVEKELEKSLWVNQKAPLEVPKPSENLSHAIERHLVHYFRALGEDEPVSGLHGRILAEVERPLILATLHHTSGNQIKAAAMLGVNRNTLRKKIRELKISTNRAEYR
tara:strand:- start:593 stop:2023 length:1431 start_codon:yes stop_codon:yes gene_type:complete